MDKPILVVEDNSMNQRIIKKMLEGLGLLYVDVADNGVVRNSRLINVTDSLESRRDGQAKTLLYCANGYHGTFEFLTSF